MRTDFCGQRSYSSRPTYRLDWHVSLDIALILTLRRYVESHPRLIMNIYKLMPLSSQLSWEATMDITFTV